MLLLQRLRALYTFSHDAALRQLICHTINATILERFWVLEHASAMLQARTVAWSQVTKVAHQIATYFHDPCTCTHATHTIPQCMCACVAASQVASAYLQVRKVAEDNGVDVTDQIGELDQRAVQLRQDTYSRLTPQQRLQVRACHAESITVLSAHMAQNTPSASLASCQRS